ncbi:hypothetical protein COLO4_01919 [Corchorus olitorius]|uniref:Calcineurin-like phosphoesterase domain-containing protein n=1 Tax=Corchorus olitorius TaxID=93759 RepID=A0A1R3L1Z0_9ROSI|nr:hypothetical protein COLO4_01919 [Corchorus olitorius]
MALMEEQLVDEKLSSLVANDFAGYHFPVNADAPIIEVAFINKPDPNINPQGSKGLGEVGIIGTAAAIANAIYNATGKRLRDLPITPDKMKRKDFLRSGLIAAGMGAFPKIADASQKPSKKSLRFAFISDIHIKRGAAPEAGMAKALQHINQLKPKVDFIINGGDAIMDALAASKENAQDQWDLFHQIMQRENTLPIYSCIGNHDIYGWFQKNPEKTDPAYGKDWAIRELKMSNRFYRFNRAANSQKFPTTS